MVIQNDNPAKGVETVKTIDEEIKQDWFKEHKATLTKQGNIEVLDWRKPGTGNFAVRYVFDGYHMYVSGDLGEAVFRFSEAAYLHRIAHYSLDYFEEKMRAFTDARRDFNQEKAVKYLKEQLSEDETPDKEAYDALFAMINDCSSVREWEHQLFSFDYGRLGGDAWEWISSIGDEIPVRVKSYLIGIKMASAQIEGSPALPLDSEAIKP